MNFRNLFEGTDGARWHEYYCAAGALCCVSTDSEAILAAARESFIPVAAPQSREDLGLHLWVDPTAQGRPPWPPAYFRGLSHLVFGAFDAENTVLVDLRQRRAIGRFSPAMAADREYLRRVIFPALFGILSQTVGVTPLHCACLERGGRGLLLAGNSGSGKSTLSVALAQEGFAFVCDDWTYFSRRDGRLAAWGVSPFLKLLPEAVEHFPELMPLRPEVSQNGELAYEVQPAQVFGVRTSASVEPHWLIFLDRHGTPGLSLSEVSSAEAAARLEEDLEDLPGAVSGSRDLLLETIRILAQRGCWLLRYGGAPRTVARTLADFLEGGHQDAMEETAGQRPRVEHAGS
jgi:hypothetical protein